MTTPVPTAGGASRQEVAVEAARAGLGLLDDSWSVGLWVFSTAMNADKDYVQLVPIGPLTGQREQIDNALKGIRPNPTGNTGLYDTVLDAYKTVLAGWDPDRVNDLVIITDGRNEKPGGQTLDQLITNHTRNQNPDQVIQVIIIGIGTDPSEAELKKITNTTGGAVYIAPDPSKIGEIFLRALALRSGT
jgi:secreted protein with Ig-like and vWFA domain